MPHRRRAAEAARAAGLAIRPAVPDDIDALEALENRAFEGDRLSRRSLRSYITSPKVALLVGEREGAFAGYVLIAFRRGTALARVYSIAVNPEVARGGVGRALMLSAEGAAIERGCISMRLEVRADNAAAIRLYEGLGYARFDEIEDYYEDGATALRLEKTLIAEASAPPGAPPYYRQTLDFTCGPSCLLMARAWADPTFRPSRADEVRLWRESTTVFMTSGLGGCEPYGLAATLARHGLDVTLHLSHAGPFFLSGVRNEEKREVMRLTQAEFRHEAFALGVPVRPALDERALQRVLGDEGSIAVVLISGYRMFRQKFPHWVVAYGHDGQFVFVNDPYVEPEDLETPAAAANLPIPAAEFHRMARYGVEDLRAALVIRRKAGEGGVAKGGAPAKPAPRPRGGKGA